MPHLEPTLCLPTPVRRLLSEPGGELWVKDDGNVSRIYGGNKPRKLEKLLELAATRGKSRLVTVGAIGSHHVLATALLGRAHGFDTAAILVPRPHDEHAELTTQQALAAGMKLYPLSRIAEVPQALRALLGRESFWIPPGGSNALGAIGYLEALLELADQVARGELPEPDWIVVALGSGGTAAGLLAGLGCSSLRCRLLAVPVLKLPAPRLLVTTLARRALRRAGRGTADISHRMEIDPRWVGDGYGHPTASGEEAIEIAAQFGLALESTYTGKAFAAALALLRGPLDRGNVSPNASQLDSDTIGTIGEGRRINILFWSTISSREPSQPDLPIASLPAGLSRLLVRK